MGQGTLPPPMIFEYRFRVRYAETDQMGIAHHAAYVVWFEAARVEWSRALGIPWADIEASGFAQAVHDVHVRYRLPSRFDQLLAMRVALVESRGPRMRFGFRLHDAAAIDEVGPAAAAVLAWGAIELVWVTREGRATRLPRDHPAAAIFGAVVPCPDWWG